MDREYWLIPKRCDLHQAIVFLHAINDNHNGKSWNASAQDRTGSYLAKKGATLKGKNITPQSVRTLLAGIPQFFGFVMKDENSTPPKLIITDVGKKIIDETKDTLKKVNFKTLKEGYKFKKTIKFSNYFVLQFIKLQLCNPNVLSYCSNIFVFPLFCLIKVLKVTKFLNKEEIAIYLFKIKDHSQIELAVEEIKNFRNLNKVQQKKLVDVFKRTENGNKSLVQAPTSSYFLSLCNYLDLFEIKSDIITFKDSSKKQIEDIIDIYKNLKPINFKFDKILWNDFYNNTCVKTSPRKLRVINKYINDIFVVFRRNKRVISEKILLTGDVNNNFEIYLVEGLSNEIEVICCDNQSQLLNKEISKEEKDLVIKSNDKDTSAIENINYFDLIVNHINSKTFDPNFKKKLNLIKNKTGKDYSNDKNLRGGRLEELFYLMLKSFFEMGLLDEHPIWNGKYDENGFPRPAPGGKGYGDIIVFINELQIIFELTSMKSKSGQEKSEAFSVPHHVKNHADEHPSKNTIGIYLAPIIHERVKLGMNNNDILGKSELYCYEIEKFLSLLNKINSKVEMENFFNNL